MAKFDAREGNSCHIHCSVRGADGGMVMADGHDMSALGRSFVAGQLTYMRELTLLLAPNINSYKRYVEGSFAPTALRWGRDNRTCAFRLVGHGTSLRLENRIPGGDVNPYLATSAVIAAGLAGIQEELELEPAFEGNAYDDPTADHVPTSLTEAMDLWRSSDFARATFGDDVVDHYANMAAVELAAFGRAVTDWERIRGFERL
jgi:glutamine synthetase